MVIDERVKAFVQLGEYIKNLPEEKFKSLAEGARIENPWFTEENLRMAVSGILIFLDEKSLQLWLARYAFVQRSPRIIGLILAGNIPLVGFHDLLCVLICGDIALIKASSKDSLLIKTLTDKLTEINPEFASKIRYVDQLKNPDAVIATGSDNSSRYFEYYFGKHPHIIRKNRTSAAILDGTETKANLIQLGSDVFSYFGLGCRNVSKLFVPLGYDFTPLLNSWEIYNAVEGHHKYHNNYHYQKSIMLVSGTTFLDNGFILLQESKKLISPIAVLYYEHFRDLDDLNHTLSTVRDRLQCIVGNANPAAIHFGQTQYPGLDDYADEVDTMQFLQGIV